MKVGYIRVSTLEQNEARQEVLMEQLGVDKVYLDNRSLVLRANRDMDSTITTSPSRIYCIIACS